jgi:16S rRNA (uracil1498-N3)-methyltransferase
MRLHRFYITEKVGNSAEITLSDTDLIHQIGNVFRLSAGDQVIVFDGSGFEYVSQIISFTKKELVLKIVESINKRKNSDTENKKVSLYLSLIKKGNFELAVEKCTEVGVDEVHPIVSERSEKKDLNLERLNKIAKEASEQSGRVTLPVIFEVTDLKAAVSQATKENDVCIAFHTVDNLPEVSPKSPNNVAVFVGPEGGWTEKEILLFKEHNFQLCSLGENILRAETAAIISVLLATQKPSRL